MQQRRPHRQHLDGARTGSRVLPRPLRSGLRRSRLTPVADVSSCWARFGTQQARTSAIMEFSTLCDLGLPVPADASSETSPPLNSSDRIRKCPGAIFRICWNASHRSRTRGIHDPATARQNRRGRLGPGGRSRARGPAGQGTRAARARGRREVAAGCGPREGTEDPPLNRLRPRERTGPDSSPWVSLTCSPAHRVTMYLISFAAPVSALTAPIVSSWSCIGLPCPGPQNTRTI